MTRNTKLLTLVFGCLFAVFLTGCLKDKDFNNSIIQSVHSTGDQKIVELSLTPTSTSNFFLLTLNSSANDTTINLVPVTLASASPAAQDIHVTLKLDTNVLNSYNAAAIASGSTTYSSAPASIYTLSNLVVTIPAGSNTGFLPVKFKPNNFIVGGLAFPFSIVSADGGVTVSGNLNTGIVAIGVKNKYDGQYNMNTKTIGWSAYGISDNQSGTWPSAIGIVTSGATTNTIFDYYRSDVLQPAFTTGNASATAFGAATPQFTFDPTTDKIINVNNTTPDDGRGRAFRLNPEITTSRYDASTKTIYAAYIMSQNGRPNMQIYDTLTYIGPR